MVELDNLKDIWKQQVERNLDKQNIDKAEIERLMKGRSTSILEKLKRNLLLEIALFGICLVLVAAVPFYFKSRPVTLLFVAAIVFIFIPYFIYYIKKYNELRRFSVFHNDIKTSLQSLILQLEKFLKIYFYGSLILAPFSVFISTLACLYEMKALGFLLYFDEFSKPTLAMILSFALLFTLISYPILKWYLRKLYGQHVETLKSYLKEMDEVEH
ncbi:MAG: hypothetical protein U0U67_06095 [Chitinophagales bacterium]